jgi:hypothetical protein
VQRTSSLVQVCGDRPERGRVVEQLLSEDHRLGRILAEPLFKPASYLFDRFPNQAMTSRPLGEVCNGEPLPLFNLAFVCRFNTFFATEICGNFVA